MKRFILLLLVSAMLALIVAPAGAQDAAPTGGVIVDATFGEGPTNFNPITSLDGTAFIIMGLIYPGLLGANPETQLIEPNAPGTLAESWEVSPDNLVYTFKLRQDFKWNNGEPVTARDFEASWKAINDPAVQTALLFITESIADMKAIDDYTFQVTFKSPSCEALNDSGIQPIQASRYADGNYAKLNEEYYNDPDAPNIGPYRLSSVIGAQQISLAPVAPGQYPDGDAKNEGFALSIVGDQTVLMQQLLAGQVDTVDGIPASNFADIRQAVEEGILKNYEYSPGDSYHYVGFNLANPENPQPGQDENGNPMPQDPHPLFGDKRVRQAISMAVDAEAMLEGAIFGDGTLRNGAWPQGTWPYDPTVPFYEFDQAAAAALLDEAGFVDADGDPSTPRVATEDALYAEPGTPFEFTLLTNDGNTAKAAIGTIMQDELSQIGVKVDFQVIEFQTLLDVENAQTFDAVIATWGSAYPFRADESQLFTSIGDTPGAPGSNYVSYINPEVDRLMQQALTLPGCDMKERAKIYGQIQHIMHDEAPYIFLYTINGMYAWNANVEGVAPYAGALMWNITDWTKKLP